MRIHFTKHQSRPHTLECLRDDGSRTWFKSQNNSDFFVLHDLTHLAVETTLGYTQAFWGMIAGGRDLDDFGTAGTRKDERSYHPEAEFAENLVGLLLPAGERSYDEFLEALHLIYPAGTPAPNVSQDQFKGIQGKQTDLFSKWHILEEEQALELEF